MPTQTMVAGGEGLGASAALSGAVAMVVVALDMIFLSGTRM